MRKVNQCLNPKLAEIIQGALLLKELNTKLIDYLPPHLREHFYVGSFNQGCLVLVTPDPVWASQLRYHLPELRDMLRQKARIYQLASIKINVSADLLIQSPSVHRVCPPLSSTACDAILAGSEQCDYEPLKLALIQLVEHAKQKHKNASIESTD